MSEQTSIGESSPNEPGLLSPFLRSAFICSRAIGLQEHLAAFLTGNCTNTSLEPCDFCSFRISVWILHEKFGSPYVGTSKLTTLPGSESRNQPLMHKTHLTHHTIPLCFCKTHIYDISLRSQYKSARERPAAFFLRFPARRSGYFYNRSVREADVRLIEGISHNLAERLRRPIDHGYFSLE